MPITYRLYIYIYINYVEKHFGFLLVCTPQRTLIAKTVEQKKNKQFTVTKTQCIYHYSLYCFYGFIEVLSFYI